MARSSVFQLLDTRPPTLRNNCDPWTPIHLKNSSNESISEVENVGALEGPGVFSATNTSLPTRVPAAVHRCSLHFLPFPLHLTVRPPFASGVQDRCTAEVDSLPWTYCPVRLPTTHRNTVAS